MPDLPPTTPYRTPEGAVSADYFETLYVADPDPWRVATSPYEAAKYAATLEALPRARYRSGLEVGCAIGVLTAGLADRCDALVAIDVAEAALDQARERLAERSHVAIERRSVPDQAPGGPFDLVVVSEVGYYLAAADLARFERQLAARVVPGGHVVLVHWTGETDYPLTAADVHAAFVGPAWQPVSTRSEAAYRLDVVARRAAADGGSVR